MTTLTVRTHLDYKCFECVYFSHGRCYMLLLFITAIEISSALTQFTLRSKLTHNILIFIIYAINHFIVLYTDNIYTPHQLTLLFAIILEYISIYMHCLTFSPYNYYLSISRIL